jgi:hypothetical protein
MKKLLILFTVIVFAAGCKNETPIDDLRVVTPEPVDQRIKVTLDVIVEKDDTFSLYYTNDGSINFGQIEPIWVAVKGSANVQQVVYELPNGLLNTQLRLDFGMNPDQKDIIFKKIAITFGDKYFEATGPHIFDFFRPDVSKCTVDINKGAIIAKFKDGARQYPSLYPEELLARQIAILTGRGK